MANKVYTLASAKGGSGKTILTATFASFLSDLKKRVLIIDSDAATNGLTLMYLKEVSIHKELVISNGKRPLGIFDYNEYEFSPVSIDIVELKNGVFLIPATFSFERLYDNSERFSNILSNIIDTYRDEFDYIFIDAQAGSDFYSSVAINKKVSDEVIIVSEYDPLSAAGVEKLKGMFRDDLTYNRTWYLLNKMIPEFIQSFSDFLEIAKYLNPIPWDADVVRAYARRRLPLDLDNGNEFTLAIIQTLKTLLGEEMSTQIDKWKMTKEMNLKKPIDEQFIELENKLHKINVLERKNKSIRLMLSFSSILIIIIGVAVPTYFLFSPKDISNSFKSSPLSILLIIIGVCMAIALFFIQRLIIQKDYSHKNIEKEVIYEKLKKLESLRYSNFDEIVRINKNIKK